MVRKENCVLLKAGVIESGKDYLSSLPSALLPNGEEIKIMTYI
jgi:hypothetical protein